MTCCRCLHTPAGIWSTWPRWCKRVRYCCLWWVAPAGSAVPSTYRQAMMRTKRTASATPQWSHPASPASRSARRPAGPWFDTHGPSMPDYNALILELYGVRNKTLVVQHQLVHTGDHIQAHQHAGLELHVYHCCQINSRVLVVVDCCYLSGENPPAAQ